MGISFQTLKNREKTPVVDVLKEIYPLAELLNALRLARSCYFYHKAKLRRHDKYAEIRVMMAKLFDGNYRCYGYTGVCTRCCVKITLISPRRSSAG